jgi:succinate dehydrogenase/fumarate reductase-like Fe-S protein
VAALAVAGIEVPNEARWGDWGGEESMAQSSRTTREVKIFRYDPSAADEGHFDSYTLEIPDETTTTILDVLLRVQREQDPSVAFRYACRVNMCGSCGMVIPWPARPMSRIFLRARRSRSGR